MQPDNKMFQNLEDLRGRIRQSINGSNKVTLGKFLLLERLGGGNYGDVYKAIHTDNQKYFAIKIIDKELLFIKNKDPYVREVLGRLLQTEGVLMQMCQSPYVVKCYDIIENKKYKIFILQYCNRASLHDELIKRKAYPVNEALAILKQIIMGLSELHKNKIIHRDLKAENIMIHSGKYKIADFGFSKKIDDQNKTGNFTVLGTRTTMAPQVKNKQKYGIKADIWSIGIIFYTMICSNIAYEVQGFSGRSADINDQIRKGGSLFFSTINGKGYDDQLKQFIKQMLTIDQKKRISWRELINHKIFNRSNQQLFENPVQNIELDLENQTTTITQLVLQDHENQLPNINDLSKVKAIRKNQCKQESKDIESQIRKQLNETITVEIQQQSDVQNFKKLIKSDIDAKLYHQIQVNNLQCHKAKYIYEKIILQIEKKEMIDLKRKSHNQLMFLLINRCFTYVSWAHNNIKIHANDQMFLSYDKQLSELYSKIHKKWKEIENKLYEVSDSLIYKMCDIKDSVFARQRKKNNEIFFTGIQKFDYTKQSQLQYTQNQYIQKIIEDLRGQPNQIYQMKLKLQSYKKINEIVLEDLDKGLTFSELVKKIIVSYS